MKEKLLKAGAQGEKQKKELKGVASSLLKRKKSKKEKRYLCKKHKALKQFNEQLALPDEIFKA